MVKKHFSLSWQWTSPTVVLMGLPSPNGLLWTSPNSRSTPGDHSWHTRVLGLKITVLSRHSLPHFLYLPVSLFLFGLSKWNEKKKKKNLWPTGCPALENCLQCQESLQNRKEMEASPAPNAFVTHAFSWWLAILHLEKWEFKKSPCRVAEVKSEHPKLSAKQGGTQIFRALNYSENCTAFGWLPLTGRQTSLLSLSRFKETF